MTVSADDAIRRLVDRRNELVGASYVITSTPDTTNRLTPDVDAIAECDGRPPLAIEHTRLLTFDQQMREDAWFRDSIVRIEDELRGRYDPLRIELTFHYVRGDRWPRDAPEKMRAWLDPNLPRMELHRGNRHGPDFDVPGVGMVRVYKRESRIPGVFVSRTVPTNIQFVQEGLRIMTDALDHKYGKLTEYRRSGHTAIMLLDCRDIALTNDVEQYKLFMRSCSATPREQLDEVWLADVWEGPKEDWASLYCFKGPAALMEAANPEGFWFGPEYDEYWRDVIATEDEEPTRPED